MNVSKRKMCVPERQNQLKCSPSWSTLLCICDIHKMKLFPQYFIFLTYTRWNFFPITSYFWPTQDEFSPHYFIFLTYTRWTFFPITSYFWPTQDGTFSPLLHISDLHKMNFPSITSYFWPAQDETFSPLLHISDLHKMKLFPHYFIFLTYARWIFPPLLHISELHRMKLFPHYFIFLTYTRWNLFPVTSYFWPTQDETFPLLHISDLHKMKFSPHDFIFLTYARCRFFSLLSPVCSQLPVPWTVFGFCWCIILQGWLIILFDFVLGYFFLEERRLMICMLGNRMCTWCCPSLFLTKGFTVASHWCSHQLWPTCLEAYAEGQD